MQITFNPLISQNKNSSPRFKAKKINVPYEMQKNTFETLATGSAILGSVLVALNQKLGSTPSEEDIAIQQAIERNTNEKTVQTIELILTKDALMPEKNNLVSVLDFIGHISNNIENIDFDCLMKYIMHITPKSLKYAQALSEIFPKLDKNSDVLLYTFNHKINKDSRWDIREPHLNKLDLPPEDFIGIAELLKFNIEESAFLQSIDHGLIYDNKNVSLKKMLSEAFQEYTLIKLIRNNNDSEIPFAFHRRNTQFIDETTEYLKKNYAKLNPFMLNEFIKSIRPFNKEEIEYLCSKECQISPNNIHSDIRYKEYTTRACRVYTSNYNGVVALIKKYSSKDCPDDFLYTLIWAYLEKMKYLFSKQDKMDNLDKIYNLYNKIEENKEKYINTTTTSKNCIKDFFNSEMHAIVNAVYVFDEKTLDTLFSKRLDNARYYLESFYKFPEQHLILLKDLTQCKTPEGKELTDNEKLNLIHIVKAFADINIEKLEDMSLNEIIDTKNLKRDLFLYIVDLLLLDTNEYENISDEEINKWDFAYLPLILKSLDKNQIGFRDLIKSCTKNNFFDFIHDPNNIYGQTNNKTKEIFIERNLDYEKYLKPSQDCNVRFIAKDKNLAILLQFAKEINENMNALRKTPLKNYIDRRYSDCIEFDKFYIPEDTLESKDKLIKFVQNIITQFNPIWKQAEENINITGRALMAQNTLTIKEHFEQVLNNLTTIEIDKVDKDIDYTIKTWSRIPQKDIGQGSKSGCCIALDRANGYIMPNYLMNTSLNMIEIIDNSTNEIIGNALYYFATNEKNENIFIIDNIEINNRNKLSDENGQSFIDAITQYASNICKEITGNDYTPIYLGSYYNDVKTDKHSVKEKIKFTGEIDCELIYLDAYGGWKDTSCLEKYIEIYRLN